MAAHQHHPQFVVAQLLFQFSVVGHGGLNVSEMFGRERRRFFSGQGAMANRVQRRVASYAKQPASGVLRDTGVRPMLQGFEQRFLRDFFGQVEMLRAEQAG